MVAFRHWLSAASPPQLFLLAIMVGIGGALGATVFHWAITAGVTLFYGQHHDFVNHVESLSWWWRLLVPTIGGLLVGLLLWVSRVKEAEGEGVPEVMEALALRRGTIRPVVAPIKIIAAALTLSSGGSAGREGPVIHIGSAIGSTIAQWCGLADRERSLLLACGAAAAIGGAFGAPFAGVVFTIEILRHQPTFLRTGLVTLSALVGAGLTYLLTGHAGLSFAAAIPTDFSWWPVGVVAIMVGVAAALAAYVFGLILVASTLVFRRIPVPSWVRPALGGLAVGLLGLGVPYIHEPAAYPLMIDIIAVSALPLSFLVVVFITKMLATGITLGSGGVGGIFAPALLLGVIMGALMAQSLVALGVVATTTVPLIILIAMAAVFAAAAHAPITAALITYEMVGESGLIIPLLIACFVATFMARALRPTSIYEQGV
jgi:CIC family chloride channel protein